MITIENNTDSTITVIGRTVGSHEYGKVIERNESVDVIVEEYKQIVIKSNYGEVTVTTFEHYSSIVNSGKLYSKLEFKRKKFFLTVSIKKHRKCKS